MSAPTGNFRGQRTQSATGGYKTIGSSIASGNNSGSFKRIFVSALGNTNGNYDLAFTKTLGIPKNYYNSSSNSHYYQQPSLSGKTRQVSTNSDAKTLTQVYQGATVESTISCVPSNYTSLSQLIAPGNNSLQATATNPFFTGNAGSYNGNLNSFNYQIPSILLLQNNDVLNISINSPEQTYNFGITPVVINNGCEITLAITNEGVYKINPICSTEDDGITTCINSTTISSYSSLINIFFPGGLYFNLDICPS
jgi:hypothetical protein